MGWGANQWLRVTKESTYGVFDNAAAPADVAWLRLASDGAFTVRLTPQRQTIRSADGGNRRVQVVASRKAVSGNLNTPWYPSQSALLIGGATTLVGDSLPSFTLDYFDTLSAKRVLGARIGSLTCGGTAQADHLPLSIGWVGQKIEALSPFAKPAATVFPSEAPYKHVEAKGGLSVGGAIANFSSLQISIRNTLVPTWDEDEWITSLIYAGRDIDLSMRLQYASAALRNALDAQTALAVSAFWNRTGGQKSTFDLKTKNYVASVADSLPLGGATYQTVNVEAFFDPGFPGDLAFAVTS